MSGIPVEDEIISSLKSEEEETLSVFPFSAVVGANAAKRAFLLVLANPAAGPLLLHGERETGKNTLLSSVRNLLPSVPFFSINYMTPEDAIFHGSNSAVEQASGGFLFVERLNIMESKIVVRIMAAADQFLFTVLATMNDEDAVLDKELADRFLSVGIDKVTDLEERIEVIKRVKEFRQDPVKFSARFRAEKKVSRQIEDARKIIKRVQTDKRVLSAVKKAEEQTDIPEERLLELLKANAAIDGRTWISKEDVEDILPIFIKN